MIDLPWPTFPMPNDEFGERIVVASVVYTDDPDNIATVLFLNRRPPFFTVAHVHEGLTSRVEELYTEYNIVPAVRHYEEAGGDY